MLCAVIKGPSYKEAQKQMLKAYQKADIVELRLDLFDSIDLGRLKMLRETIDLPVIFTLRSLSQGGQYSGNLSQRIETLGALAGLKPDYLDIEYDTPEAFVNRLHKQIKLIISYHDFEKTYEDFSILKSLQKLPASFYKIATMANSTSDALRTLTFMKHCDPSTVIMNMGEEGKITRILSPLFGNPLTYASLDSDSMTAPGQLSLDDLLDFFHYKKLSPSTKIYGLIGNPVSKSFSHITHNMVMLSQDLDAVYVKMPVQEKELKSFFNYIRSLPFQGLSVTMPLKEAVIPFLDEINPTAKKIGAVNTVLIENGRLIGHNTDGRGALDAIENKIPVTGKKIIILGAGGAAKAIAYTAVQRGGEVCILNRDMNKAKKVSEELGCRCGYLEEMKIEAEKGYDVLINCTPLLMPIDSNDLFSRSHVMDINTRPKETTLLQHALKKNCSITYGYQMFAHQAAAQFNLWFGNKANSPKIKEIIEKKVLSLL